MTTKQLLTFTDHWQILIGVAGGLLLGITCIAASEGAVGLTLLLMVVVIVVLHFAGMGSGVRLHRAVQNEEAEQGE